MMEILFENELQSTRPMDGGLDGLNPFSDAIGCQDLARHIYFRVDAGVSSQHLITRSSGMGIFGAWN
jgi:hypothetical protein